jgi:hypothetical protein
VESLTRKYAIRASIFEAGYKHIQKSDYWRNCTDFKLFEKRISFYVQSGRKNNDYYTLGMAHALREIYHRLNKAVVA